MREMTASVPSPITSQFRCTYPTPRADTAPGERRRRRRSGRRRGRRRNGEEKEEKERGGGMVMNYIYICEDINTLRKKQKYKSLASQIPISIRTQLPYVTNHHPHHLLNKVWVASTAPLYSCSFPPTGNTLSHKGWMKLPTCRFPQVANAHHTDHFNRYLLL